MNQVEQCEQRNIEFLFESKVNDDHDVNIVLEDVKFEYTIHNVYLSFYSIFFNNFWKSDKPESPG